MESLGTGHGPPLRDFVRRSCTLRTVFGLSLIHILFGSVTSKDIAEAVGKAFGQTLDKRKIVLDGDIKNFGTYEVDVKVYPKVTAKIKVNVEE